TVEEKELAAEIDLLQGLQVEVDAARWYARPWKRWRLWRRLIAFLRRLDDNRRRLARREVGAAGGGGPPPPPVPPGRWLWGQPRDAATLSFLVLPDRVFVARSRWLSLAFAVRPVTRVRVRETVRAWHELARSWLEGWNVPRERLDDAARGLADDLGLSEF